MGRFDNFGDETPLVDPDPTKRGYLKKEWLSSSPSQSETAARCMMKHWLDKVAGVEIINTPKSQKVFDWGTAAHEQLEDILNDEPLRMMEFTKQQVYVDEAHAYIRHIKPAVVAVEIKMVLEPGDSIRKVPVNGRIDLLMPDGIIDHKTTSGHKRKGATEYTYALNERNLGSKIQTNLYAWWYLQRNPQASQVLIELNYIQRNGYGKPPKNWQVRKMFTREEIRKNMVSIDKLNAEMYINSKRDFDDVPINTEACHDYNAPCPYMAHCEIRKNKLTQAKNERLAKQQENRMARVNLASLMAEESVLNSADPFDPISPLTTPTGMGAEVIAAAKKNVLTLDYLKELYGVNSPQLGDTLDRADDRLKMEFSQWRTQQIGINPLPNDTREDHAPGERIDRKTGDVITPVQELKGISPAMRKELAERGCETLQDVCDEYTQSALKAIKGIGPTAVAKLVSVLAEQGFALPATQSDAEVTAASELRETDPVVTIKQMDAPGVDFKPDALVQAEKVAAVKKKAAERIAAKNIADILSTTKGSEVNSFSVNKTTDEEKNKYTSMTLSRTLNLGDYNSIRIDLTMEVYGDVDKAFEQLVQDVGDNSDTCR